MTTVAVSTPVEVDTALAALYTRDQNILRRFEWSAQDALSQAGAEFYYRGKRRVTDMTLAQAEEILAAELVANHDASDYAFLAGNRRSNLGSARRTVAILAECRTERTAIKAEMEALEALYTGWSRFFLVTSSPGHIHSSMHCSTCRVTTTYGWLPQMSGRTEADCVAEHGPALCSICFPSAPVEWTLAEVTKAQAAAVSA